MNELHNIILDHSRKPRNTEPLSEITWHAEGHNPDCSDHIKVFVHLVGDLIKGISFSGESCAICTASCSLMTEHVKKLSIEQCLTLFEDFHSLVTVDLANKKLGKLQAFAEVKDFPVKVKCVMAPWYALKSALEKEPSVSI